MIYYNIEPLSRFKRGDSPVLYHFTNYVSAVNILVEDELVRGPNKNYISFSDNHCQLRKVLKYYGGFQVAFVFDRDRMMQKYIVHEFKHFDDETNIYYRHFDEWIIKRPVVKDISFFLLGIVFFKSFFEPVSLIEQATLDVLYDDVTLYGLSFSGVYQTFHDLFDGLRVVVELKYPCEELLL